MVARLGIMFFGFTGTNFIEYYSDIHSTENSFLDDWYTIFIATGDMGLSEINRFYT